MDSGFIIRLVLVFLFRSPANVFILLNVYTFNESVLYRLQLRYREWEKGRALRERMLLFPDTRINSPYAFV